MRTVAHYARASAMSKTVLLILPALILFLFLVLKLVEQVHDVGAALDRVIVPEQDLRYGPEPHAPAQLRPDERRGAFQALERFFTAAPVGAHEDLRVLQVVGDLDPGHGNKTDAGVLDLSHQDVGDFIPHLVADARRSFIGWFGHGIIRRGHGAGSKVFEILPLRSAPCSLHYALRKSLSGNPAG